MVLQFALILALCTNAIAAEEIKLAAGTSVVGYFHKFNKGFDRGTGIKIVMTRDGGLSAENSLMLVDSGQAEIGIVGTSWENVMKVISEKKVTLKHLDEIQHRQIGKDRLNFIGYPGAPKALSKEQLAGILLGKIKNWKEAGGEDQPIQIVIPVNTSGTQKVITDQILGGEDFYRRGVKSAPDYPHLVKLISTEKGTISFIPGGENLGDVTVIKTAEIVRPIVAFTKGPPSAASAKLMDEFAKTH